MKGLPDYVDGPLGTFDLEANGTVEVVERNGRLVILLNAPTVRVYDVWVEWQGEWCQLNRLEDDVWHNEDVIGVPETVRLWLGRSEAPAVLKVPEEAPAKVELSAYVPLVDGAPPLPGERAPTEVSSRLARWVHVRSEETVIRAVLDEWNLACAASAALGWMPNTPAGGDLMPLFARAATRSNLDPDDAFARWLVFETGRAVKRGVEDRLQLEARRAGVKLVQQALERVVRAVAPTLNLVGSPPAVVGPLERHHWLVDEGLAKRVGNAVAPDTAHRPVFVLRPLLIRDDEVIVEGEVV